MNLIDIGKSALNLNYNKVIIVLIFVENIRNGYDYDFCECEVSNIIWRNILIKRCYYVVIVSQLS